MHVPTAPIAVEALTALPWSHIGFGYKCLLRLEELTRGIN